MYIEFRTGSGRAEPTKKAYVPYWDKDEDIYIQKGFNASFEISSRFVNLGMQ